MIITSVRKYIFLWMLVLIAVVNSEGKPLTTTRRVPRSTVKAEVWNNKKQYLWPNGVVPFNVDYSLENKRSFINKAFNYFHQNTCIRFVQMNKDHYPNYINITDKSKDGCKADVGRIRYEPTYVYLSHGSCFLGATILHELLHVLGFVHELQRPDRNQYVEINYEELLKTFDQKKIEENFDIIPNSVTLSPYDYASIMHSGKRFINVKRAGAVIWDPQNNGYGLSELDLKHVNELYNCSMNGEHMNEA